MSRFRPGSNCDLLELILGYGLILLAIWTPEHPQHILSLVALVVTLGIVLARRPNRDELGLGRRGFLPSLWILLAAVVLVAASLFIAKRLGTFHPLFNGDIQHVTAYTLWTVYQQFLLNDLFMPRLTRVLGNEAVAVTAAAVLFGAAHLPNLWLAAATLVWGVISCALFARYRNLYVLGLAQGLLGLCFAVCVPDALHHHLRVGLGYLRYHSAPPGR